ncbi:imidazolonepropionase-like amidohydrolase [Roseiarcus fermentans]|uniref:Imidazolonepropionase-like amidohydrolase n=1 Tax=Roseiarcus fermentans TaxID=1473586 RepID=A0A366F643_9HYPH|nr:amidohydrolase family protein [Roseiarcus fermentans]RBP09175.1 imidazolonepropionase-like amidohydrolase [Roseiarcus fermentans]
MVFCAPDHDRPTTGSSGCACCRPLLRSASRRIEAGLSRRGFVAGAGASLAALGFVGRAEAQRETPSPPIVFVNFRLFDGRSADPRTGLRLLVRGDRIAALEAGDTGAPDGARVIDCDGRTIMPGLIDAHWHTIFAGLAVSSLLTADIGYIVLAAAAEAERTLLRGFTTVRDLGGPAFALKQAIDDGLARGPRIFPCGAMITTTGGHGDLRPLSDLPRPFGGPPGPLERTGAANIADSADEVRLRVREQLLQGASQIKLVGGGGVSSPRTSLDMLTFSEAELRAGVEAASDRNTYVAVHAYPPAAIRRALAAGALCVEHGHLMDEATAKLMADTGVWLSTQPFLDEADTGRLAGQSRLNALQVFAGTETLYPLAKEHKLRTAFGSDLLFSSELASRQGVMLTHLRRWYDPVDILRMATSTNGELLALSGPRNPYPGKLGVVERDALADLIVVDGDPLADITLLERPGASLALIMKGGRIYKDEIGG